jgi:GNAT superfamily N-acetyltransferase
MPTLRPLTADDAEAVYPVQVAAFDDLAQRFNLPPHPPGDPAPGLARIRHLARTDPQGAWLAAEDDGTVVGAALALVREGLWGLSLLVVKPGHQSSGTGRALLEATLGYADGTRGAVILASEDARALRVYANAGFALHPAFDAAGELRRPPAAPSTVREGRWPEDRALVDAAGRHARGASHAGEVPVWLEAGMRLLVHDGGGFAMWGDGGVRALAATDDTIAADLLRAVLAAAPAGEDFALSFMSAAQQWAMRVALDAGLQLRPGGAVAVRGEVGPLHPYLPSGAYL